MVLTGPCSYFELNILGYQYQPSNPFFVDRNWLMVRLRSKWQEHEATITAPLLLTWEVDQLISWLDCVTFTRNPLPHLRFTEPGLSFFTPNFLSDKQAGFGLQVRMGGVITPYWNPNPSSTFSLPVAPTYEQLNKARKQLCAQSSRFPPRSC